MSDTFEFTLHLDNERVHVTMVNNLHETKGSWDSSSHNHAGFELHVLLSGSATVDVEGRRVRIGAKQAIFIGPGQYHRPVTVSSALERVSVAFSPADGPLRRALLEAVGPCRVMDAGGEILTLCRGLVEECPEERSFRETMVRSRLALLLGSCFRLMDISGEGPAKKPTSNKYTDRIDAFFETCLRDGSDIDRLAAQLHLSRSQVSRVLKKTYGMTFREKLIRTRMDQAAWLLRHTDRLVSEVSAEVGYVSESRFYKMFRERTGMTPEQYRAQYREENQ